MPRTPGDPAGDDFDAADFLRDDPARPAPPPRSSRPAPASDDVFELADPIPDAPEDAPVVPPVPLEASPPRRKARPAADIDDDGRTRRRAADQAAKVEQVWSRGAEWGPTLVVLAVAGLLFLGLLYLTFDVDRIGLSLLILLVGGAAWVLLAYPIVITLERPVRITPEQAVKDFYGALSHHLPHYRRMWLLLSSAGRTSSSFGSPEGFRGYWKARLASLRQQAGVSGSTPLVFEIADWKSDKSAGQAYVEAKWTVNVSARGRRDRGPFASIRVESSLVRGPDNMWYLNLGTLPDGRD